MHVTVETNSNLERTMRVAIPEEQIAAEVESRLKNLSRTTRIQGFRPGKAPYKLIRQRFEDQVRVEVVGMVLRSSLSEAITQKQLRPAGSPEIEELDAALGKGLTYTARFEILPDVQLKPVEELRIETYTCQVTDDDINKMIEVLRKQRHELRKVDRDATAADVVEIDYTGTVEDKPFPSNTATHVKIDLSARRMPEGFEAGLTGTASGAETTLNLRLPDSYPLTELAGKPVEFKVQTRAVYEKVIPELNDEFFKTFGVVEGGLEAFRKRIQEQMEREAEQMLRRRLKEHVMQTLRAANTVELPKVMVTNEKHRLKHQFEHKLKEQGLNAADLHHAEDETIFEEQARNRVALQLIVAEVVRRHDIKVDAAKVRQSVLKFAENYQDPNAIVNWYYSDKDRLAEIEALTLENQVIDWIVEKANTTKLTLTFDECMNKGQTASM